MWPVLIGLAGVLVTAAVTFFVAKLTNSGQVATTPATDLWAAMRSELARQQTRLAEVEGRLAKAEADLNVSRSEVIALQAEAARLRLEVERLAGELTE